MASVWGLLAYFLNYGGIDLMAIVFIFALVFVNSFFIDLYFKITE